MVIFNPGMVTQSIVQPDRIGVDFRHYAWVGVVTPDNRVCYGYGADGPKTWDEMMQGKQFILGSTGKASGNYINGAILREVFHAPIKQIMGFPGSAEQRLAIERGELDGDCGTYSSIPQEWLNKGLVAHLCTLLQGAHERGAGKRRLYRHVRKLGRPEAAPEALERRRRGRPALYHVEGCARGSSRDCAQGVRRHHERLRASLPTWKSNSFRCTRFPAIKPRKSSMS